MTPKPITLEDGRVFQPTGRRGIYYRPDGTTARVEIEGDSVRLFEPMAGGAEIDGGRIATETAGTPRSPRPKPAERPDVATTADRFATFNAFIDNVARHLSAVEVVVWTIMYRDCRNGTLTASNRDIERRSGSCLRVVTAAVQRLREAGLIEATKLSRHKGEPSQYRMNDHPERCVSKLVEMNANRTGARNAPGRKPKAARGTGARNASVDGVEGVEPVHQMHHSHKAEGTLAVCLAADGPVLSEHTDFLDRIVPAILGDATALLTVVCRPDEPEGTHVVDLAAKGFHGLCFGSGHKLATAHGLPGAAVLVTVRRRLSETLTALGDWLRFPATWQLVPEVARPHIELVALHEAAHALATPIDGPPCPAALESARQLSTANIQMPTAAAMAATHGAAWAAGLVVLCRRAAALRRRDTTLSGLFAAEAADFGVDFEAVARLVRTIPDHEPLRPLLADPIFLARIEHAIAPPDERARIIAANRTTARLDVPGERPPVPSGVAASRKVDPC